MHLILIFALIISGCAQTETNPEIDEQEIKNLEALTRILESQQKQINKEVEALQNKENEEIKEIELENRSYYQSSRRTITIGPLIQERDILIEKSNKNFHYQLQSTDYDTLTDLDVDYLIIDIDDSQLSRAEVNSLSPTVLSYLSIGEAEDYREYWNNDWEVGNPEFLSEENPNWPGNYKVEYWNTEWQNIILNKVDEIVDTGYDGIYLDIVDAYEYFERRDSAREEMIDFVIEISQRAKSQNRNILIIPQNAEELIEDSSYRNAIDGIAKESTWYIDNEETNPEYTLSFLRKMNLVLSTDYPTSNSNVCDYYEKCNDEGFYCNVANRDLDLQKPIECKQRN